MTVDRVPIIADTGPSHAQKMRARGETSAAARLGMPVERYRELRALGYRWCSFHATWQPATEFRPSALAGQRSYCIEADKARNAERWQARRARKEAIRHDPI